jgi:hypothetical protein
MWLDLIDSEVASIFLNSMLCVRNRDARADRQCGELIDRIAASLPVRELVFVEALGHARVPIRRAPAGSPRRDRAGRDRRASCRAPRALCLRRCTQTRGDGQAQGRGLLGLLAAFFKGIGLLWLPVLLSIDPGAQHLYAVTGSR